MGNSKQSRAMPRRAALAFAISLGLASGVANAAALVVNSVADGPITVDASCTLREAVESINTATDQGGCVASGTYGTNDGITFGVNGTIPVGDTLGMLADAVVTGPGAALLTLDGGGDQPVIYVDGSTVAISGVTITGGGGAKGAGAVTALYSQIDLSDCVITDNAGGFGAGLVTLASQVAVADCEFSVNQGGYGGAIALLSSAAVITGSTFEGNVAGGGPAGPAGRLFARFDDVTLELPPHVPTGFGTGGGVLALGDFGGKGLVPRGGGGPTLEIDDSTFTGNIAVSVGGGVVVNGQAGTIRDSTFNGNGAGFAGGGLTGLDATVAIENSTFSGNTAALEGGAIALYSGYGPDAQAIRNTTITDNTTAEQGNGGAVVLVGAVSATIPSSILANTTSPGGTVDLVLTALQVGTPTVSATNSLVENPGSSGVTTAGANLIGVDPLLGTLADNGGPTQTHLPSATSPVRDAGANPAGLAFDQRGTGFPRVSGSAADIGSVEIPAGGISNPPQAVPTLSQLGALLLAGVLAAFAWLRRRRDSRS